MERLLIDLNPENLNLSNPFFLEKAITGVKTNYENYKNVRHSIKLNRFKEYEGIKQKRFVYNWKCFLSKTGPSMIIKYL